jgi:hypothetical protein
MSAGGEAAAGAGRQLTRPTTVTNKVAPTNAAPRSIRALGPATALTS